MRTIFYNQPGLRSRRPVLLIIDEQGVLYKFKGRSIPKVCHVVLLDSVFDSKHKHLSYHVWAIYHRPSTELLTITPQLSTGRIFPKEAWIAGYIWLAERVLAATVPEFQKFIRAEYPATAKRWDAVDAAEKEFADAFPIKHNSPLYLSPDETTPH